MDVDAGSTAIVARLRSVLAQTEPPHGIGGHPARFPVDDVRLAMAAVDLFLGRIPDHERLELGLGLGRSIHAHLGRPIAASLAPPGSVAASAWDVIDQILAWLKSLGDAAGSPVTVSAGLPVALGFAIYYKLNPPSPSACTPRQLDKWRHCYVGCKIAFWAPGGFVLGQALAVLKEIADAFGLGTAEIADITATLSGIYTCGYFESCETCCCNKGY